MSEDGSEDTPPRPKRKIKKVQVLSSGSSSDSDESITAVGARRKRLRVVSDDGSESSSSGSPVVCARSRRSRPLPKLRGLDDDSDTSGWATDHSDAPKPAPSTAKPTSGFASDSSEGNSDKCSICLLRFTNQEVGTPQICEHIFCLDCITEWSKNVNTCPVDRMTFDSIVVRSCAGGRVLRTEPVKVVERRPSIEMLVTEDPTVCEVCGSADNEATMLLCDGCDLGYHMQCLTPPLTEVPLDQWLCPNCDELLSDVDILFSGVGDIDIDMGLDLRRTSRESRGTRSRNRNVADEPSTSSGRRGDRLDSEDVPSTSRGSRTSRVTSSRTTSTRRRNTAYKTSRSRHKRRRTKTVIIEYEVQGNSKFPITKRVKRKIKKKTKRRQTRTAARRTHVRASVRAKLASMTVNTRQDIAQTFRASAGVQELSARRQRAGIPSLSLFGNSHQLDYFSEDDEHGASEGASTAVAVRPTSSILSEYRQARRKMIGVPSPSHASAAPDLLSSILESQTLLHSKKSVVSITVDGRVNIKLESRERTEAPEGEEPKKEDRVDLSRGEDAAKKVPSYPGQSRGGGWGGGYRGSYHREQNANNFNRGGNHENNSYGGGGGYQNRPGNPYHQNNNMQRNDNDTYNNYARRPHQYPPNEELNFDRNRRPPPEQRPPPPALGPRPEQRYSTAPSWQPYTPPPAPAGQPYTPPAPAGQPYTPPATGPRPDAPPLHHRHSFGGFENPLDMRMARMPRQSSVHDAPGERFTGIEASQSEKHHRPFRPLPEPPMFKFDKQDIDKSEDEKSDSGLVIDTEKYDPTEPTNDDDSGDEEKNMSVTPAAVPPAEPLPTLPPPPSAVQSILAGIDTSAMNVPPNVLDSAVRQVLKEHRNLIVAPTVQSCNDRSDEDSDGDCPNFSIYSATSVHIANNTNNNAGLAADVPTDMPEDNLEDLVQEDDETPIVTPESGSTPVPPETDEPERDLKPESIPTPVKYSTVDSTINRLRKTDEELKEKVSKRCPITTNPRNPIKIKLNTPSLIKRQVTLYDEEEEELSEEIEEKTDLASESREKSPNHKRSPVNDAVIAESKSRQDSRKEKETSDQESAQEMKNDSPKKYDKIPGLSDTEDEPPARPDDAKMDVDEDTDRHEQQTDHEEELEPEPRAAEPQESPRDARSDEDEDEPSGAEDAELRPTSASPTKSADRNDDMLEKMTESISETEDERSYTPCLDENKSKDTSMETEKDKGIEGLDTEMISEDEGNGMFSDAERAPSEPPVSPREPAVDGEEGEILDKKKEPRADEPKKKKKKDSKKEGKEKKKGKKGEVAFKKLSKSGKERNYREREKDKDKEGKSKRERRDSSEAAERLKQKRKEKRKDLERYDVRTLVTEKRRRPKDPFGRDVSPRGSPSPSPPRRSASPGPRRSPSPVLRRSPSPVPRRSPSPVLRRSPSPGPRVSPPRRRRASSSPRRARLTPSPRSVSPRGLTPARARRRRRSASPPKRLELRRRRSADRPRKRRRSGSGSKSPRPKPTKRKKRARSERSVSRRRAARRRSPRRRRARRRSGSRSPAPEPPPEARAARSPGSVDSRLLSPRTPPPEPSPPPAAEPPRRARRRRDPERARHRRPRDVAGPSKEVFTSGDNILVSVSFKEQDRPEGETRRERRRERRKRRRRAAAAEPEAAAARPVAIIDLERSPFRELTPSPRNVIVLSDSEPGDKEAPTAAAAAPAAAEAPHAGVGPQTPPTPAAAAPPAGAEGGPATPPEPPESPDAYDPYEPTRSASASPASARVASPQRTMMTLETAQKTNMSADDVIDRRPLSPIEKVMALLQSTRDVSPEPPPGDSAPPAGEAMGGAAAGASAVAGAPASLAALAPPPAPAHAAPPVRIVLPSPTRAQPPKLFLAKPSPIKSDPIKPMQMQAPKVTRALSSEGGAESPYSPGSSDFGDLFSPPGGGAGGGGMGGMGGARGFDALLERPRHRARGAAAKVPVKLNKKKGKTQVGVKIDEDNLKILDDLPSSAVEMQVKSKFLKKLNRQERVVEEVKLVLKPHYNKKHVTKDEYKDILRRAVPKICHNKTGEINPTKIQALVEAYVKKFRKKHKLGLA